MAADAKKATPPTTSATAAAVERYRPTLPSGLSQSVTIAIGNGVSGRYVVARRAIKKGEVLVVQLPLAAALNTDQVAKRCDVCYRSVHPDAATNGSDAKPLAMRRCGACRHVRYCSVACQQLGWTRHKPECAQFQKYNQTATAASASAASDATASSGAKPAATSTPPPHPSSSPSVIQMARLVLLRAAWIAHCKATNGDATSDSSQREWLNKQSAAAAGGEHVSSFVEFDGLVSHIPAHTNERKEMYAAMSLLVRDFVSARKPNAAPALTLPAASAAVAAAGAAASATNAADAAAAAAAPTAATPSSPQSIESGRSSNSSGSKFDDDELPPDATADAASASVELPLVELIEAGSGVTVRDSFEWWARFSCNNYTISDAELKPVGIGCFPLIGLLFNHSCEPNCVVTFDTHTSAPLTAQVVATSDIAAGDELAVSYIDLAATRDERRKQLRENYYFDCACVRCSLLDESAPADKSRKKLVAAERSRDQQMRGFRCTAAGCKTGVVVITTPTAVPTATTAAAGDTKSDSKSSAAASTTKPSTAAAAPTASCVSCNSALSASAIASLQSVVADADQLLSRAELAKKRADSSAAGTAAAPGISRDRSAAYTDAGLAVRRLSAVVHPSHLMLYRAARLCGMLCVDSGAYRDALGWFRITLPLVSSVMYPVAGHPLVGLEHYLIAKLEALLAESAPAHASPPPAAASAGPTHAPVTGELHRAVACFQSAYEILSVSHGSKHPLVLSLADQLQNAVLELQYGGGGGGGGGPPALTAPKSKKKSTARLELQN